MAWSKISVCQFSKGDCFRRMAASGVSLLKEGVREIHFRISLTTKKLLGLSSLAVEGL